MSRCVLMSRCSVKTSRTTTPRSRGKVIPPRISRNNETAESPSADKSPSADTAAQCSITLRSSSRTSAPVREESGSEPSGKSVRIHEAKAQREESGSEPSGKSARIHETEAQREESGSEPSGKSARIRETKAQLLEQLSELRSELETERREKEQLEKRLKNLHGSISSIYQGAVDEVTTMNKEIEELRERLRHSQSSYIDADCANFSGVDAHNISADSSAGRIQPKNSSTPNCPKCTHLNCSNPLSGSKHSCTGTTTPCMVQDSALKKSLPFVSPPEKDPHDDELVEHCKKVSKGKCRKCEKVKSSLVEKTTQTENTFCSPTKNRSMINTEESQISILCPELLETSDESSGFKRLMAAVMNEQHCQESTLILKSDYQLCSPCQQIIARLKSPRMPPPIKALDDKFVIPKLKLLNRETTSNSHAVVSVSGKVIPTSNSTAQKSPFQFSDTANVTFTQNQLTSAASNNIYGNNSLGKLSPLRQCNIQHAALIADLSFSSPAKFNNLGSILDSETVDISLSDINVSDAAALNMSSYSIENAFNASDATVIQISSSVDTTCASKVIVGADADKPLTIKNPVFSFGDMPMTPVKTFCSSSTIVLNSPVRYVSAVDMQPLDLSNMCSNSVMESFSVNHVNQADTPNDRLVIDSSIFSPQAQTPHVQTPRSVVMQAHSNVHSASPASSNNSEFLVFEDAIFSSVRDESASVPAPCNNIDGSVLNKVSTEGKVLVDNVIDKRESCAIKDNLGSGNANKDKSATLRPCASNLFGHEISPKSTSDGKSNSCNVKVNGVIARKSENSCSSETGDSRSSTEPRRVKLITLVTGKDLIESKSSTTINKNENNDSNMVKRTESCEQSACSSVTSNQCHDAVTPANGVSANTSKSSNGILSDKAKNLSSNSINSVKTVNGQHRETEVISKDSSTSISVESQNEVNKQSSLEQRDASVENLKNNSMEGVISTGTECNNSSYGKHSLLRNDQCHNDSNNQTVKDSHSKIIENKKSVVKGGNCSRKRKLSDNEFTDVKKFKSEQSCVNNVTDTCVCDTNIKSSACVACTSGKLVSEAFVNSRNHDNDCKEYDKKRSADDRCNSSDKSEHSVENRYNDRSSRNQKFDNRRNSGRVQDYSDNRHCTNNLSNRNKRRNRMLAKTRIFSPRKLLNNSVNRSRADDNARRRSDSYTNRGSSEEYAPRAFNGEYAGNNARREMYNNSAQKGLAENTRRRSRTPRRRSGVNRNNVHHESDDNRSFVSADNVERHSRSNSNERGKSSTGRQDQRTVGAKYRNDPERNDNYRSNTERNAMRRNDPNRNGNYRSDPDRNGNHRSDPDRVSSSARNNAFNKDRNVILGKSQNQAVGNAGEINSPAASSTECLNLSKYNNQVQNYSDKIHVSSSSVKDHDIKNHNEMNEGKNTVNLSEDISRLNRYINLSQVIDKAHCIQSKCNERKLHTALMSQEYTSKRITSSAITQSDACNDGAILDTNADNVLNLSQHNDRSVVNNGELVKTPANKKNENKTEEVTSPYMTVFSQRRLAQLNLKK